MELYITLALPVFLIPLCLKLFLPPLIYRLIRRRYLKSELNQIQDSWKDTTNALLMQELNHFITKKQAHNRGELMQDVQHILKTISAAKGQKGQLSFSIKRLSQCMFLAFGDLYRMYAKQSWFKLIEKMTPHFLMSLKEPYTRFQSVMNNPVIAGIWNSRVLPQIFRFIMIPIFGIPSIIWYACKSVFTSLFLEGFLRYFYSFVLIKTAYYALFLYGEENNLLEARLKGIPKEKFDFIYRQAEFRIKPDAVESKSPYYSDSVHAYLEHLKENGLAADPYYVKEIHEAPEMKWYEHIGVLFHKGLAGGFGAKKESMNSLFIKICKAYGIEKEFPLMHMRLGELIYTGYLASVLILHHIIHTPGIHTLADKITLEQAQMIQKMGSGVKNSVDPDEMEALSAGWKIFGIYNRFRKIYKVIRGFLGPASLAFSLTTPILMQQFIKLSKEYGIHRIGRLAIILNEMHYKRKKPELTSLLW